MKLPDDYLERVYAGVLGKIIGVYLGRPFEGWTHERISRELGDINGYVNDRLHQPLVVTDDDITGTFTFLRALADNGTRRDLGAREIGEAWLNYIIEGRTILWWGGMGESTEHTAFLRLKSGIEAPRSGSRGLNGRIVSEQIGAQIFIDGWAMVAPGDPELAVRLAGEAARVSHDGEAVFAAQLIAAMESAAFSEPDIGNLLNLAVRFVPADSIVRRVTDQVREWCGREPDWKKVRALIEEHHGYARYGGHVPAVPNFAVVLMALLCGKNDFQKSLLIANTSGWDTDCNSGNVGCLLGIKGGLSTFEGPVDWRGPVADRMYMPTADPGRGITDAVSEAVRVAALGRVLADAAPTPMPKGGARFHFELPGSAQGFCVVEAPAGSRVCLSNVAGHSKEGTRSLQLRCEKLTLGAPVRIATPTFIPPEALAMKNYELLVSPTLFPGQTIRLRVAADGTNAGPIAVKIAAAFHGADDEPRALSSPEQRVAPGESALLSWTIPETGGCPIFQVGMELTAPTVDEAIVYLDSLGWMGTPNVTLRRPPGKGGLWRRAWVNAFDHDGVFWPEAFRLSQDRGTGLLITGGPDWADYRMSCTVSSDMAAAFGIAVRVQGLRRFYALVVKRDGKVELQKELQGTNVLASADFSPALGSPCSLALEARGNRLTGYVEGRKVFDLTDGREPLERGGIALLAAQGTIAANEVRIEPTQEEGT